MTVQLPAVVVVGGAQLTAALTAALQKTRQFADVYSVNSATELLELTADLPDGKLVYLLSPTVDVDMEEITLESIGAQISSQGHYVLAVGGDPAGEAFAKKTDLPVLRPRTNLVQAIAPVCGVEAPAPNKAPAPTQQQTPAKPDTPPKAAAEPAVSDDIRRGMAWREAQDARESQGSRELAPRPGNDIMWKNAVEESRRQGALQPGHRARGYVISFAARKGGVGKTTISVNSAAFLGRQLANSGRRVVLIDLNIQQSDIGNYIHRHSPNVHDIVRNPNLLTNDQIEDALVYSEKHNFHALLGPTNSKDARPDVVHFDMYKQIIDLLRNRFDYILVDTPVGEFYHDFLRMVLPESNYIVVPLQPARVTLDDISEWLSHITAPRHSNGYGIDPRKVGLVLNRAKLGIGMDPPDVEDRLSGWKFVGMFPDSDEWQLAENTGGLIGSNPPKELEEVFRHMLHEATFDKALTTGPTSVVPRQGEVKKGKFGWLKKLLISS